MRSGSFERFGAGCALVGAAVALAYSVTFVLGQVTDLDTSRVEAVLLLAGGILAVPVFVAVRHRIRRADEGFATLALVFGVAGGIGSAVHGGFDLARFLDDAPGGLGDVPNPVDPRGLLTFGFTALAVLAVGWVVRGGAAFPRRLGSLSLVAGVLLLVVYLGRLIVLDPKNPVLLTAAVLSGFLAVPALYAWIGLELRRPSAAAGEAR